jgi:hypothetical protein
VFVAVQAYRFFPTELATLKYMSPTVQVAGSDVPVFIGRVYGWLVKSAFRPCVPRLISVCPELDIIPPKATIA